MSRPEAPKTESKAHLRRQEYGLSGSLQRELHELKSGSKSTKDAWGDQYGEDPGFKDDF
jgi:hypothetical protein